MCVPCQKVLAATIDYMQGAAKLFLVVTCDVRMPIKPSRKDWLSLVWLYRKSTVWITCSPYKHGCLLRLDFDSRSIRRYFKWSFPCYMIVNVVDKFNSLDSKGVTNSWNAVTSREYMSSTSATHYQKQLKNICPSSSPQQLRKFQSACQLGVCLFCQS